MRRKDDSVDLEGLRQPILIALITLNDLHKQMTDQPLTITSGAENIRHSVERSAHHRGDAVDVRIWQLASTNDVDSFVQKARKALGPDYVVLLEKTHIHVHWSPKYQA